MTFEHLCVAIFIVYCFSDLAYIAGMIFGEFTEDLQKRIKESFK